MSEINKGMLVLLGITHTDDFSDIVHLGNKVLNLRLWSDSNEKAWAKSVKDMNYEILVVS